jgi:L-Ala-D/L-Glu epimerase
MKIRDFQIYHVKIPLNLRFRHAKSSYEHTDNIILKITLDNYTGFGECIPREFVTGETIRSAASNIKTILRSINTEIKDFGDVKLDNDAHSVARCAVELALFDAIGKAARKNISAAIGKRKKKVVYYSGIIPHLSIEETKALAYSLKGFKNIKVKVGFDDDIERLAEIRKIVGRANILVDANCAWTPKKAQAEIKKLARFNIKIVEQPAEKGRKVTSDVPLMADESICSVKDALKLSKSKQFDIFNIRLSKCGGIMNSMRIAGIALDNDINIQLGCHVGETGILSAAGRALAFHYGRFKYHEGSYGKYLLKEDIIKEDISFGKGGIAYPIEGHGLGVTVDESRLEKYSVKL